VVANIPVSKYSILMSHIIFTVGSKDNFIEDIHLLARRWSDNPRVVAATGQEVVQTVTEKASALFLEEGLVLALLDPSAEALRQVASALDALKDRAGVIIYATSPDMALPPSIDAERVNLEQEREKRFRERVLATLRADGKKMTDRAFDLLKERIGDEALLPSELAKLIDYMGEKQVIEAKDVSTVVTDMREEDFIALSEAVARRNRKEIVGILEALLSQGMDVLAVHGFLARRVRLLMQARDGQGALGGETDFRTFSKSFGKLKEDLDPPPLEKRNYLAYQKPYYAFNLAKASRKYGREDLISFFDMLARFDGRVKKGTRHDRVHFEAGLLGV
jgi:DNA polymerase III delta subunit